MKVHVPSPLHSYTNGADTVDAVGETMGALFEDLDRRFPGFRFRIVDEQDRVRPHIKLFVNENQVQALDSRLAPGDTVHIIAALSGGQDLMDR